MDCGLQIAEDSWNGTSGCLHAPTLAWSHVIPTPGLTRGRNLL